MALRPTAFLSAFVGTPYIAAKSRSNTTFGSDQVNRFPYRSDGIISILHISSSLLLRRELSNADCRVPSPAAIISLYSARENIGCQSEMSADDYPFPPLFRE